jgi:hypothetical protein
MKWSIRHSHYKFDSIWSKLWVIIPERSKIFSCQVIFNGKLSFIDLRPVFYNNDILSYYFPLVIETVRSPYFECYILYSFLLWLFIMLMLFPLFFIWIYPIDWIYWFSIEIWNFSIVLVFKHKQNVFFDSSF